MFTPGMTAFGLYYRATRMIGKERRSLRAATRFALRGMVNLPPTLRLLRHFASAGPGCPPPAVMADTLLKIGRQHVRRGLSASQRAEMMIAHYEALRHGLNGAALGRLLHGGALRLARMSGRGDAETYEIWLHQTPYAYRREGETTLSLWACAAGLRLADVTFAMGRTTSGALCTRIGGIQGPPPPHGKEAVKLATKALDGLRPKAAIVEAMYQLGKCLGGTAVIATSLRHHVMLAKNGAGMHRGPYDTFWEEIGGIAVPEGDYLLPATPPHRDAADVPAKRRKEWERRQQRLADLSGQIRHSMASLGGVAPPREVILPADQARFATRAPALPFTLLEPADAPQPLAPQPVLVSQPAESQPAESQPGCATAERELALAL